MLMDKLGVRKPSEGEGTAVSEQTASAWYLEQAIKGERDKVKAEKDSKKIAWRVAGASVFISLVAIVASAIVAYNNKPNPPAVLLVDKSTGEIRSLKTLAEVSIPITKATDLFNLRRYVELRESYDWYTIQDTFDATIALSSPTEASSYRALYSEQNPLSPVNVLRKNHRVIAKAGTVTWVGKTALVSFSKTTVSLQNGGPPPVTKYYVATIAYNYENEPMDDNARAVNASGFKTLTYTASADITKEAAVANTSQGDQP